VSLETNNEVEKGSNKLVVTVPNSEPKTYSYNWYFNCNDFETKGNKIFVIRKYRHLSFSYQTSDRQVTSIQQTGFLFQYLPPYVKVQLKMLIVALIVY
jgi:hypothetical protein